MLRQQAIILMIVSIVIFLTADLLGENSSSETEEAVRIIITRDNGVFTESAGELPFCVQNLPCRLW